MPGGQRGGKTHHSPGQGFADAHNVRGDRGRLAGKETPRTSETCGDLVGNEEDVVVIAHAAKASNQSWVVESHATGPLHDRLNNHARNGVVDICLEFT